MILVILCVFVSFVLLCHWHFFLWFLESDHLNKELSKSKTFFNVCFWTPEALPALFLNKFSFFVISNIYYNRWSATQMTTFGSKQELHRERLVQLHTLSLRDSKHQPEPAVNQGLVAVGQSSDLIVL